MTTRRKFLTLDYTLVLHGVTSQSSADVAVTLIDNDRVAIATTTPIALKLSDFNLEGGREKLQEAANVEIVPLGFVNFDFAFNRSSPGTPPDTATLASAVTPGAAALETKGNLDREACVGRFEILSRTGNIYFSPASARLSDESYPLLDNLYDIVNRCPDLDIEIGGHTDSDGSDSTNQRLSERRAGAVGAYLSSKGIPSERMRVVGYGESKPIRPNDTRDNKARNRRIEFTVLN